MKSAECSLCGGGNFEKLFITSEVNLIKCRGCGVNFNSGEYDKRFIYNKKYYNREILHDSRKIYNEFLLEIKKYKSGGRLLDVGCGNGQFLDMAAKGGWNTEGIELPENLFADKSGKFKIHFCDFEKLKLRKNYYDVITMWDVIEHLGDVKKSVRKIYDTLKTGGVFFVWTLNQECLMNKVALFLYKSSFGAISYPAKRVFIPQHVTHFDKRTLKKLLESQKFSIMKSELQEISSERLSNLEKLILLPIFALQKCLNMEAEQLVYAKK